MVGYDPLMDITNGRKPSLQKETVNVDHRERGGHQRTEEYIIMLYARSVM